MTKNKIVASLITLCIAIVIAVPVILYNCGCPHDWQTKTPLEKLDYSVDEAEGIVKNFNENLIPEVEKQLTQLCKTNPPPEWCVEVDPAMQDLKDALEALEIILGEAKQALELADGSASPSAIAIKISGGLIRLSAAYMRIKAIIDRH